MNCGHCTFLNPPTAQICEMCFKSFNNLATNVIDESDGIQCDSCTYLNSSEKEICGVCGSELYVNSSICHSVDVVHIPGNQIMKTEKEETIDKAVVAASGSLPDCPQRECKICYGAIGTNYFAMFHCIHIFCIDCGIKYFTTQITERPILCCICPMCNLPDLHSDAGIHDEYFSLLLACLKPILDENIMNVFEKKLTDMALLSDPNFVWCVACTSGFVNISPGKMVKCHNCRVRFCVDCKRVWKKQHEKISCEQFAQWERDNDFEVSHEAIGTYLQENGIDCPKCKFKYDLSRGGCIHFTCTQCKYEFCFGCSKPFVRKCTVSAYCNTVGLHAHHQRNCIHYLRDKDIADLQGLLTANNIKFMVDSTTDIRNCPIELQTFDNSAIVDTICNEPTESGQAGLCNKHYKEYLILTITKAKLETTSILNVKNYHELLRYQGVTIPSKSVGQQDTDYGNACEQLVKNNIPLE